MWNYNKVISKGEYNYVVVKHHPHATKNGYVLEHRIVVENHINRLLLPTEVVHHIDENKKNNDISNLQIMTQTAHSSAHTSERGRMCVELQCPECGQEFTRFKSTTHLQKPSKLGATFCGSVCRGKFSAKVKYDGLTETMI